MCATALLNRYHVLCVLQSLLSVAGDGSICIVPLQQLSQPDGCEFKPASGWSGYSQGRWVDSNTFVTVSHESLLSCGAVQHSVVPWYV